MAVNGMLAGMVAITAHCAFVDAPVSGLIGAISGVLVVEAPVGPGSHGHGRPADIDA